MNGSTIPDRHDDSSYMQQIFMVRIIIDITYHSI